MAMEQEVVRLEQNKQQNPMLTSYLLSAANHSCFNPAALDGAANLFFKLDASLSPEFEELKQAIAQRSYFSLLHLSIELPGLRRCMGPQELLDSITLFCDEGGNKKRGKRTRNSQVLMLKPAIIMTHQP